MLSPLATPTATRNVLDQFGLSTKKALGQHFLVNDHILEKIIALAEVRDDDAVLEVGPGIGTLTIPLLKTARHVIAVERDRTLIPVLEQTCAPWRDRLTLIEKDALDLTIEDFGTGDFATNAFERDVVVTEDQNTDRLSADDQVYCPSLSHTAPVMPDKFVANLPYAVAATLVLDFFERFATIQSATVMVQREVADRMRALPGTKNYGAYTVKLGLYARPAGGFSVSPDNFFPPPRVDSAVIRLDRSELRDGADMPIGSDVLNLACLMADAAFANRRKTLGNSFKVFFSGKRTVGKGRTASARKAHGYEGDRPRSEGALGESSRALSDAVTMNAQSSTEQDRDSIDGIQSANARLGDHLPRLFSLAGIDPRRRGETLSQSEFITLARAAQEILGDD